MHTFVDHLEVTLIYVSHIQCRLGNPHRNGAQFLIADRSRKLLALDQYLWGLPVFFDRT